MLTSVQQTTAAVVLKLAVVTLRAASLVHVCQDIPEMDSPALVSRNLLHVIHKALRQSSNPLISHIF